MKKLLSLALCSAIVFCTSTVIAQDPNTGKSKTCDEIDKDIFASSVVESVNINENKQPQEAQEGGYLSMKKAYIATGHMLIGEKNNDDNFKLQHYARLNIQRGAELQLQQNSMLKIQIDGKLTNRGKLELKDGSTLISPLIDIQNDLVQKTTTDGNNYSILKHGIDNRGGVIVVNKGSNIYWEEKQQGTQGIKNATIYKGTVDFESFFKGDISLQKESQLLITLEGVTIKLFDPTKGITDDDLKKIKTFQDTFIGNDCVLDGEFDFTSSKSKVIKLDKKVARFSQNTVVRIKGEDKQLNKDALQNLFKNGSNLKINCKEDSEQFAEQPNYFLSNLLTEFNKANEETILNTNYTNILNRNQDLSIDNKQLVQNLTNDWYKTIDKGIFPLECNKFETQQNGWNNYDIHFKFAGKKSISFELQTEKGNPMSSSKHKISLYGDFSKYNALINEKLEDKNNIINYFVQKYSGSSPYLKTNWNTTYVVSPKDKVVSPKDKNDSGSNAINLRFYKNESGYAALNTLKFCEHKEGTSANVGIDYSYDKHGVSNYAQTLCITKLKMCDKNSTLTIRAGQSIILGTTDANDMNIPEYDEFELNDPKNAHCEYTVGKNDELYDECNQDGRNNLGSRMLKGKTVLKTSKNITISNNYNQINQGLKTVPNNEKNIIPPKEEIFNDLEEVKSNVISEKQFSITETNDNNMVLLNKQITGTNDNNMVLLNKQIEVQNNNNMILKNKQEVKNSENNNNGAEEMDDHSSNSSENDKKENVIQVNTDNNGENIADKNNKNENSDSDFGDDSE